MIPILALAAVLQTTPQSYSGRDGQLDVPVPRVADASIQIDGVLDEPAWAEAAVLDGFTQYEPVEGVRASQETRVHVFYGPRAIYFGVEALDVDPDRILARLGERDRSAFNDDWIRLMLDTFDDQRQAYVFYVNPLGIQTDGLWIEGLRRGSGSSSGVSIDFNPDFIWESQGRVTARGWVAEIRIPYVSLRFREIPTQSWGFNIAREVKRTGFKQSWAPLTQDVPSTLAQSGRLTGLRDLHPRRLVEVNPVVTGRRTGALRDDGSFHHESLRDDYGLNLRYGVTRNLTLDATVNPDFSQIEADANRITVNERFALFFPEKRPFFLEGTEIFQMPQNLVYTRQIVDPDGGAKLTGKVGAFQVGYLGARDASPTLDDAFFNIVRVRRDVGTGSSVGVVYTDRSAGSAYNRVLAGDARLLLGRYTVTTQLASSWDDTGAGDGPRRGRPLLFAQVERSGRNLSWEAQLNDVNPGFRTRSGFIQRVGDAQLQGQVRYTGFGTPGAFLERWSGELRVDNYFTHEGLWAGRRPLEHEIELQPSLSLRGDRTLTFVLRNGYFRFRPEDYTGYQVSAADGSLGPFVLPPSLRNMKAFAVLPRMRITDALNLNGRFYLRELPIYAEASRGFEVQLAPSLTVRPTNALSLSFNYTWSRIERHRDGSLFSTAQVSRLNLQYQFSRALSARLLGQYSLEERSALIDPVTGAALVVGGEAQDARESGEFQGQALLQYEPGPGTIFYVGYTRLEQGARSYDLSRLDPVEDGLFLKLSYLFRM